MPEKICSKCKKTLSFSEFYVRKTGKRINELYEKCKLCMKLRGRLYYHLNRERQLPLAIARKRRAFVFKTKYINEIKDRPCRDCGGRFPLCAMDFDHLDPKIKLASIAHMRIMNWCLEKIKQEIEKCDVVCSNCHRVRTYNRLHAEVAKLVTAGL